MHLVLHIRAALHVKICAIIAVAIKLGNLAQQRGEAGSRGFLARSQVIAGVDQAMPNHSVADRVEIGTPQVIGGESLGAVNTVEQGVKDANQVQTFIAMPSLHVTVSMTTVHCGT